jgi:hypothetical protein
MSKKLAEVESSLKAKQEEIELLLSDRDQCACFTTRLRSIILDFLLQMRTFI